MASYVEKLPAYAVGASDLVRNSRVKFVAGSLVVAGLNEDAVGHVVDHATAGSTVTVRLLNNGGTMLAIAAGVITAGADLYAAADGKVQATNPGYGVVRYRAIGSASGDGSIIEVLPVSIGVDTPTTFTVGAADLSANQRVKLVAGLLVVAGEDEACIGHVVADAAIGATASVRLINEGGKFLAIAGEDFLAGADLYAAANGKVQDTDPGSGTIRYTALQAATGDGSVVEVLPTVIN